MPGRRREQRPREIAVGKRQPLALEPREVVGRPALARLQVLEERGRAPGTDAAARHLVGVVGADEAVVGGDDPAGRRVEDVRQLVEGHEAQPVAVRRSRPGTAARRRPRAGWAGGRPRTSRCARPRPRRRSSARARGTSRTASRNSFQSPARCSRANAVSSTASSASAVQRSAYCRAADRHQRTVARGADDVIDGAPGRRERALAHADRPRGGPARAPTRPRVR